MNISRTQIEKLFNLLQALPDAEVITLKESSTGIGPIVTAKFSFCGVDLTVDLTEVDKW